MTAAPELCVLIVEDDPDIRLLFSTALSLRGYQVTAAANGDEALAALESGQLPSAIIADLHMPVMDGWKLLSALHADPRLSAIPVVVVTAVDDRGRDMPRPSKVLLKPVSTDALVEAIETAVADGARTA